MKTDILIVGSGCAGLYAAIHLPADKKITIITSETNPEGIDSFKLTKSDYFGIYIGIFILIWIHWPHLNDYLLNTLYPYRV